MRILVVGPPASGKTTVTKEIGRILNVPTLHVDAVSFRQDLSDTVSDVSHFVNVNDSFVIDGNYSCCFQHANRYHAILFIQTSRWTRGFRLLLRVLKDWFRGADDNDTGLSSSLFRHLRTWIFSPDESIFRQTLELTNHCDTLRANVSKYASIVYVVNAADKVQGIIKHLQNTPPRTFSVIRRANHCEKFRMRIVKLGETGQLDTMWSNDRSNWLNVDRKKDPMSSWNTVIRNRLSNESRVEAFVDRIYDQLNINVRDTPNTVEITEAIVFGCEKSSDLDVIGIVSEHDLELIRSGDAICGLETIKRQLVENCYNLEDRPIDLNVGALNNNGLLSITIKGSAYFTQEIVEATHTFHRQFTSLTSICMKPLPPQRKCTLQSLFPPLISHILKNYKLLTTASIGHENTLRSSRRGRYQLALLVLSHPNYLETLEYRSCMKTLTMKLVQCLLCRHQKQMAFRRVELESSIRELQMPDQSINLLYRRPLVNTVLFEVLSTYKDLIEECILYMTNSFNWTSTIIDIPTEIPPHIGISMTTYRNIMLTKEDTNCDLVNIDQRALILPPSSTVPMELEQHVLFLGGQRSDDWREAYQFYQLMGTIGTGESMLRSNWARGALAELTILPQVDFTPLVGSHSRLHIDMIVEEIGLQGSRASCPDLLLWMDQIKQAAIVEVKTLPSRPEIPSKSYWRAVDMAHRQIISSCSILPHRHRYPKGVIVLLFPEHGSYVAMISEVNV